MRTKWKKKKDDSRFYLINNVETSRINMSMNDMYPQVPRFFPIQVKGMIYFLFFYLFEF